MMFSFCVNLRGVLPGRGWPVSGLGGAGLRGMFGRPLTFVLGAAALGPLVLAAGVPRASAQQGPLVLTPPARTSSQLTPSSPPPASPLPTPRQTIETGPAASPAAPPATNASSSGAPPEGTVVKAPSGIQADTLGQINPETVGVLDQGSGGFGVDLWRGTPRAVVETLFSALPVDATSPVVRDLMRRTMLSRALAPTGESLDAGVTLLARRITILSAMGDIPGATQLIDAIPGRVADEKINRIEADVRLLNGDNARACALAQGAVGAAGGDQEYWRQALIFCQALAGKMDAAALGVSLLREQGVKAPVFYTLMDAFTLRTQAKLTTFPDPTPLTLAMARALNVALPEDVATTSSPAILRVLSSSPNAPLDVRLDSAERVAGVGALGPDELRQIYESVSFSQDELASPLSRAEKKRGAWSRALLYRAALGQAIPSARAETLARALKLGREDGRYALTARAFAPLIAGLEPSSTLAWLAPEALRALIVAGDDAGARRWLAFLRTRATLDSSARDALTALMPIVRLSGLERAKPDRAPTPTPTPTPIPAPTPTSTSTSTSTQERGVNINPDGRAAMGKPADGGAATQGGATNAVTTDARAQAWWAVVKNTPNARARASMLYALLSGLGDKLPVSVWRSLLAGSARLSTEAMQAPIAHALDDAARNGRVGETVLLSLVAIGRADPAGLNPMDMERIVAALGAVGLQADARKLSLEIMLASAP
ncbi:hypothetical protein [Varunaivibrio sulfuroxidans]|uniref:Antifreeze glycopeptide polyprotein n=1 Tax=Varunaivibrio sulfuroxidans TaxID=1773489 RepID=A0A4R3JCV9_9PROT|nr:hypothetical protein [Varunaivibrio sulfuroxidans]TCS63504.1 hypothetical protein EDD55_103126 [Varunaivibrio sulfuroxidans]WES30351.1 hypothetical protein P3M64_12015 [Varunaivibrio sulfuroxidans]